MLPCPLNTGMCLRATLCGGSSHPECSPAAVHTAVNVSQVYALLDRAGGDANAEVVILLEGLDTPVGIAWLKGSLYVSGFAGGKGVVQRYDDVDAWALQGKVCKQTTTAHSIACVYKQQAGSVARVPYMQRCRHAVQPRACPVSLQNSGVLPLLLQKYGGPPPALVTDALPSDKQHGYHYLRATPDGAALIVSLGVPCNVCPPSTAPGSGLPYGSLLQLDLASRKLTPYATGACACIVGLRAGWGCTAL